MEQKINIDSVTQSLSNDVARVSREKAYLEGANFELRKENIELKKQLEEALKKNKTEQDSKKNRK